MLDPEPTYEEKMRVPPWGRFLPLPYDLWELRQIMLNTSYNTIQQPSFSVLLIFLSLYSATPSLEDYVQVD